MTAAERLIALTGASGTAAERWRRLAAGVTTGAVLVAFSGMPGASAGQQLMAGGGGAFVADWTVPLDGLQYLVTNDGRIKAGTHDVGGDAPAGIGAYDVQAEGLPFIGAYAVASDPARIDFHAVAADVLASDGAHAVPSERAAGIDAHEVAAETTKETSVHTVGADPRDVANAYLIALENRTFKVLQ